MFLRLSKGGSKVCKGGRWLEADEEGSQKGQWRRSIHVCTQETHNEGDRRGGQREKQGVTGRPADDEGRKERWE